MCMGSSTIGIGPRITITQKPVSEIKPAEHFSLVKDAGKLSGQRTRFMKLHPSAKEGNAVVTSGPDRDRHGRIENIPGETLVIRE